MKTNIITTKQYERFAWIDKFVAQNGRLPNNLELKDAFNLHTTSSTFLTLKKYKEYKQENFFIKLPKERLPVYQGTDKPSESDFLNRGFNECLAEIKKLNNL